jgi:hypothetical protein
MLDKTLHKHNINMQHLQTSPKSKYRPHTYHKSNERREKQGERKKKEKERKGKYNNKYISASNTAIRSIIA